MPEMVGATQETGAVVLTLAAAGIGAKRGALVDPLLTWDPASGTVTVRPAVGSDGSGGVRHVILNGTTGVIGHMVVGDVATNLSNAIGWLRVLQVRAVDSIAFSLVDYNAGGTGPQQFDIVLVNKRLEIYDATHGVHVVTVTPPSGAVEFVNVVTAIGGVVADGVSVGHGAGDAIKRLDNVRVGITSLSVNTTGQYLAAFGVGALGANTTGTWNAAIGRMALALNVVGSFNFAGGPNALLKSTGDNNTAGGALVLQSLQAGNRNTAFGAWAGLTADGVDGLVLLGYSAGRYELGGNAFYVDNQDRLTTAAEKAGALLYGIFNANPALQTLRVNASLSVLGLGTGPLLVGAVDSDGVGFRRVRVAN